MHISKVAVPKIVVIGAGHLGSFHLEKLSQLQKQGLVELVGAVDIDSDKRSRAQKSYAVPIVSSLSDLTGHIDAAIVATPTSTHHAVAMQALERKLHVLIEKPISSSLAYGRALVAAAQRHGVLLQIGHTERFNPATAAALKLLDHPQYIVAERLGRFTGRSTEIDVVLDLMIHDLDMVGVLVPAELSEVRSIGVPVLTREIDMAAARLQFADGCVAQLSAGRASLEAVRKIRVFTAARYVSIDCNKQEVKSVRRLPPAADSPWPQIAGEAVDVIPGDALLLQDEDFLRCIREGCAPRVDGAAGLRALELAQAVKQAMTVPSG
ncbi:MAG: Gfo/Idh/MocA family oxidoreductase [Myxococcota bacterium]